ncbi:MAG TPA: electron transport complex subunit RsxC [Gammaproteobacteria bacterium]
MELEYTLERKLTGGVRLLANKAQSTATGIRRGFVPTRVVLALRQHRGSPAVPVVAVGDDVLKGQLVAAPGPPPSAAVHAPTSGRVRAIEERTVPGGRGLERSPCVIIDADGLDRPADLAPPGWPAAREERLRVVREGGLAGLGGAVFPTADKLAVSTECKALIVNGAECEPYISCDDLLMREAAPDIVAGALAMTDLLGAPLCIMAVERDKPRAIEALAAAARAVGDPRLRLAEVRTVYPAGGERQLIELLTGEEVPSGGYPSDIGYVCQNVGTAYALARWLDAGEPLIARVVTVTGKGVRQPQNVLTPLGTPFGELVALCGGYTDDVARLVVGGSMMGYAVPDDDLPVTKAVNCIIAAAADEVRGDDEEWPCIRCADCASACPAGLLPQELLSAAEAHDMEDLGALGLFDCIECGCCDVVCPSQIRLTERFRAAKREYALHEQRERFATETEVRVKRREQRRADAERREAELRQALKEAVRHDPESGKKAIEAAVRRARERRKQGRDSE